MQPPLHLLPQLAERAEPEDVVRSARAGDARRAARPERRERGLRLARGRSDRSPGRVLREGPVAAGAVPPTWTDRAEHGADEWDEADRRLARVPPRTRHRRRREPGRAAGDPRCPPARRRGPSNVGPRPKGDRAAADRGHHPLGRADGRGRGGLPGRPAADPRVPDRDRRGAGRAPQRPPREHARGDAASGRLPALPALRRVPARLVRALVERIPRPDRRARARRPFRAGRGRRRADLRLRGRVLWRVPDRRAHRRGVRLRQVHRRRRVPLRARARDRPRRHPALGAARDGAPRKRPGGRADARLPLVRRLPRGLSARPLHGERRLPGYDGRCCGLAPLLDDIAATLDREEAAAPIVLQA